MTTIIACYERNWNGIVKEYKQVSDLGWDGVREVLPMEVTSDLQLKW